MATLITPVSFAFNGLAPGLFTFNVVPRSAWPVDENLIVQSFQFRSYGSGLPSANVMSGELGLMGDPVIDPNTAAYAFPAGAFSSGGAANLNFEAPIWPFENQGVWVYVRLNGTAAPAAKLLLSLTVRVASELPHFSEQAQRAVLVPVAIRNSNHAA